MMLLHSVKERAIKVKGQAYGSRPGSTVALRTLTSNLPLGGCILRIHLVPKVPGKLEHSNRGSCCPVSLDLLDLNSKALSQGPRRCLLDGASFCFSLSCACCINSSSSLDWLGLAAARPRR